MAGFDPFSFEDLTKGAEVVGDYVIVLPAATYPIHIRGLGGRNKDTAIQMARELTEAVELLERMEKNG